MAFTTAAHSTVTFNDVSSSRFVESGTVKRVLGGVPIVGGPRNVEATRLDQDGAFVLRASHDGYVDNFNVTHERALMLAADGNRLDGEELFTPAKGDSIPAGRDNFAIRFHLHPSVKASRLTDSHGAMLMLPNKEVWTFSAYEDRIEIEESVYLAGPDGPRRALQLVIYGRARKVARVQWTFSQIAASPLAPKRGRVEEPKLPL